MSIIADLRVRLAAEHPELQYDIESQTIRVKASTAIGFDVSLTDAGDELIVGYGDGWHEHFKSMDEAIKCFAFGVSGPCRLKVIRRGRFAYRWTVEYCRDGEWIEDSTTGGFPWAFWLPRRVEYLRNCG